MSRLSVMSRAVDYLSSEKVRRNLFLVLLLSWAAALRCIEIDLPYVKIHETGFQETLALNHLQSGIAANEFLSVMAEVDSTRYFHVSHPPLLQYTLALFFFLLGNSEWAARVAMLPFSVGTVYLVYFVGSRQLSERIGQIAGFLAAVSLLSSYFGRIVNFEVVAQFFVLLFYVQFLRFRGDPNRGNLAVLVVVFILGCLSDWPFYFILPGMVLYLLIRLDSERWLRSFVYSLVFLAAGFGMVGLYAAYQHVVTGHMVLAGHGQNRIGPGLLLDPAYYDILFRRFLTYAPVLLSFSSAGLLAALGRGRRYLAPVVPLLFVPVAYVTIFAQAAQVHEWALYYFAVPMALLSAMFLDWAVGNRRVLCSAVCGLLVLALTFRTIMFHDEAKEGIFADLYELSMFLRNHVEEGSVVFSAIFFQLGYYLEGRAEVLFPFAKGDLTKHSYDCFVLDKVFPDPYTENILDTSARSRSYRSILESARYQLICDAKMFSGHLLLNEGPANGGQLVRLDEAVRLALPLPISADGTVTPVVLGPFSVEGCSTFSYSVGLVGAPPLKLRVFWRQGGEVREIFHQNLGMPAAAEGDWRRFDVSLAGLDGGKGSFLVSAVTSADAPGDGFAFLGDPVVAGEPNLPGSDSGGSRHTCGAAMVSDRQDDVALHRSPS